MFFSHYTNSNENWFFPFSPALTQSTVRPMIFSVALGIRVYICKLSLGCWDLNLIVFFIWLVLTDSRSISFCRDLFSLVAVISSRMNFLSLSRVMLFSLAFDSKEKIYQLTMKNVYWMMIVYFLNVTFNNITVSNKTSCIQLERGCDEKNFALFESRLSRPHVHDRMNWR